MEGWQSGYCNGLLNRRWETGAEVRILYLPPLCCDPAHVKYTGKNMEDCPRGLWSLLGKQVGVTATQVRILYLPPNAVQESIRD